MLGEKEEETGEGLDTQISGILEALECKKRSKDERRRNQTLYKTPDTSIFARDAGGRVNCSTAVPETN